MNVLEIPWPVRISPITAPGARRTPHPIPDCNRPRSQRHPHAGTRWKTHVPLAIAPAVQDAGGKLTRNCDPCPSFAPKAARNIVFFQPVFLDSATLFPSKQSLYERDTFHPFGLAGMQALDEVQYTECLNPPLWQNLGSPIPATSSSLSFSDSIAATQRFYRIVLFSGP
jgi:hypothetical protein